MNLVIVESPAKAKTINKYLGKDYKVIASFGHIRDLPTKNGSVLPEDDFNIKYEISEKAEKYVSEIVKSAKKAEEIILATDPDREGEAISWHVVEVLKDKKVVKDDSVFKRVAFNEITKKAVLEAVANPRKVDSNLVNAQQARRALDYLVGFNLSPVLWRKLPGSRSAGRVQSVALRLICDREDEIEKFVTQEYWDISLEMIGEAQEKFSAKLTHLDGNKLEKFSIPNENIALEITGRLKDADFAVSKITKRQQKRHPAAPFITSSLQQEASRKLGFSAKKTMQIAQKLYEGVDIDGETIGLITYMRTDGVTLSNDAITATRSVILDNYGGQYLPKSPRMYKSKAKNAQEAHEAIRPTNVELIPKNIESQLDKDQFKLYNLIWMRTVACQMESVVIDTVAADITSKDGAFIARANGSVIVFDGFYKLYMEGKDDAEDEKNNMLPKLEEGEELETKKITPDQHFTEPPPRYSEASLVKKMEELGIGRPSTYASIISVLQDRKYATLEKKRFIPSELGRLVTVFLVKYFAKYVEYDFTAHLETELDMIADGDKPWKDLLNEFWQGFNSNIEDVSKYSISEVIEYVQESLDFHLFGDAESDGYKEKKKCPSCKDGKLSLKLGKYGAFLACSSYPDCQFRQQIVSNVGATDGMDESTVQSAAESDNKLLGQGDDGVDIFLKKGPYGFYVQLGEGFDKKEKPKRVPIPSNVKIGDIDLSMAKKLLSLPLHIGKHSKTDEEILMGIGRYGPYLKYQDKFISIPRNTDPFTVEIGEAEKIIAAKEAAAKASAAKVVAKAETAKKTTKKANAKKATVRKSAGKKS